MVHDNMFHYSSLGQMNPQVCILLSSYNGEKYIKTQIDSILNQNGINVELVIRDDGSTDKTVEIIKSYGDQIRLFEGDNCGCEKSFAELLKYKSEADYYAFADQDDYWLPNKVITEINAIKDINTPALAACNLYLCDDFLNIQGRLHSEESIKQIREKMKSYYLCNMHGCVLLWNRSLHEKINISVPLDIISHDGWVNTVANAIGTTVVLDEPLIQYRVHENNVSGHASSLFERIHKAIRLYLGKNHPKRDIIAQNLLDRFESVMDLNSRGYQTIKAIACYKHSIKNKIILLRKGIIRNTPIPDRFFWELCVLLGKY